ncbi:hypothetical protein IJ384_05440 [bacterium]|nr:hypothetical protein [bacterium]
MNISAINNQSFQAKKIPTEPMTRINTVGKVNGYVEEMLCSGNAKLQDFALGCNVNTRIAQKGDSLIVNSGPVTDVFNMKKMASGDEFYLNIMRNMEKNGNILTRM